jgi:hypothetical protein
MSARYQYLCYLTETRAFGTIEGAKNHRYYFKNSYSVDQITSNITYIDNIWIVCYIETLVFRCHHLASKHRKNLIYILAHQKTYIFIKHRFR